MNYSRSNRLWISFGIVLAIAAGGIVVGWYNRPSSQPAVNLNQSAGSVIRERYATLYEAAWRQDQGQGNVLMTATLFLPEMITVLGADTARSDYDDQLFRSMREISADQAAIFITLDSVAGPISDVELKPSLALSSTDGRAWSLADWRPLIRPSVITNSGATITPQGGVAVFSTAESIDWVEVQRLTLVSRGLGGVAERRFVWIEPSLWLTAGTE